MRGRICIPQAQYQARIKKAVAPAGQHRAFLIRCLILALCSATVIDANDLPASLTPAVPPTPRINGPSVFGARPGSEFLYTIPVTGDRPVRFAAVGLPPGLKLDDATGRITGRVNKSGTYAVALRANNAKGSGEKKFRIIIGDKIALTPPMGWNSWNCWAGAVDQEKTLRSARAMVASGLINHGWTYINIDDTWQGRRGGPFKGLQANEKFPDMKSMCAQIHEMGLKAGIYSTPWITSYAKFAGGSSDDPSGAWSTNLDSGNCWRLGKYNFAENDARQWADWGIDYLKFDWNPIDLPHTAKMAGALRKTKRDIVFSLSNLAPYEHAADWARLANCWRTTGDIWDGWENNPAKEAYYNYGVSEIAFSQDPWAAFAGPGHWNDPDMLVVGYVGWGPQLHASHLTPDEQYTHISMWCMLSAPLLIGCDLERLDSFTLGLLGNDEVLALDQDALGKQATRVASNGPVDVFMKDLEDGSKALGFFNRSDRPANVTMTKLSYLGFHGTWHERDLWRQKNLPDVRGRLQTSVPAHGVVLLKLRVAS
jgi:alpha-galactosidase